LKNLLLTFCLLSSTLLFAQLDYDIDLHFKHCEQQVKTCLLSDRAMYGYEYEEGLIKVTAYAPHLKDLMIHYTTFGKPDSVIHFVKTTGETSAYIEIYKYDQAGRLVERLATDVDGCPGKDIFVKYVYQKDTTTVTTQCLCASGENKNTALTLLRTETIIKDQSQRVILHLVDKPDAILRYKYFYKEDSPLVQFIEEKLTTEGGLIQYRQTNYNTTS